jgi:uncharacterized BrkB/YihY/UPF0761 family membrane protein
LGTLVLIWSAAFIQRKNGGFILILLSVAMLLFGGGLFPPLIGIIAGAAGQKINKPLPKSESAVSRIGAKVWPWPLVIFLVWVFGQWIVGYYFNEFLQRFMIYGVLLILVMLPLSVYTAFAHDVRYALRE